MVARRTLTALTALAALVGLVLGAAWVFQRRLIYLPDRSERTVPGAEEVFFPTDDGLELAGSFLPAQGTEVAVAVVFNGNAGNRADRAPLAHQLASVGISTLLFDYRGYGGNPGAPSEEGLYRDGRAAVDYAFARASAPLVYIGESLGTAVAVEVATTRSPAALVLRSPFTSLVDVGKSHYWFLPVGFLLKDRFPTIDRIGGLTSPLLVVASTGDEIVPYRLSQEVFAAAPVTKQMATVEGVGHNDPELGVTALAELVASFVEQSIPPPAAG